MSSGSSSIVRPTSSSMQSFGPLVTRSPRPVSLLSTRLGDAPQSEAQALGVVYVLIPSEPTEHRLSQHSDECMPTVPARAGVSEHLARHRAEAERIVEFAVEHRM